MNTGKTAIREGGRFRVVCKCGQFVAEACQGGRFEVTSCARFRARKHGQNGRNPIAIR
jgi:hypothetical protein